jgi:hypothetical protein
MPCMCWYHHDEKSLQFIKNCCQLIVNEIKALEKEGDPIGCKLKDAQKLLEHLYTGKCDEKPVDDEKQDRYPIGWEKATRSSEYSVSIVLTSLE